MDSYVQVLVLFFLDRDTEAASATLLSCSCAATPPKCTCCDKHNVLIIRYGKQRNGATELTERTREARYYLGFPGGPSGHAISLPNVITRG